MNNQPVKLDYAAPPRRRRGLSRHTMRAILLAPTLIATLFLAGIPSGLAEGGFPDEGPLKAALCGFLAMVFATIGSVLAAGRSLRILTWNACVIAAGVGGCILAGHA